MPPVRDCLAVILSHRTAQPLPEIRRIVASVSPSAGGLKGNSLAINTSRFCYAPENYQFWYQIPRYESNQVTGCIPHYRQT